MQKKFLSNLAFFLIVNLLIKPIYVFGIDRVVQNRVGVEAYGNYFSLFSFILILQIILDMGLENFNRKEIAQNPEKVTNYFTLTTPIKIALGFFYLIICALIAWARNFSHEEWSIFLILVGNQFMASFILYLRANMGGLQLFKVEGLISVLDRGVMIVLCGILLYTPFTGGHIEIKWFVLCQTLAYAVTLLLSLGVIVKKTGKLSFHLDVRKYLPILRGLLPFAILVLLQAYYYRIDPIFLEEILPNGEEQAGIYAHAFRIIELLGSYALLFPMILLPLFSNLIQEKKNPLSLLNLGIMILIVPSFIFMTAAVYYRYEIFEILYTSHIQESANTFAFLSISFLGMGISYTYGALLTANKNLKQLNYMSLTAVIISTVLNLILIPRYQVLGAAIANAGVQIFAIIMHVYLVHKHFSIKTNWRRITAILTLIICTLGIGFLIKSFIGNFVAGIVLIAGISLGIAILLRIFNIKEFITILREGQSD